jgi:hypothetical protein
MMRVRKALSEGTHMLKPHIPRVARGAALTLAITAVGCTLSAPASAETTISAFKGVPTLAGLSTSSVYSYDDTAGVSTRTEVIRGGVVVDQKAPTFDLVAGDTIQAFNSTTGGLLAEARFDGLAAFTAGTCVGSAALNGLRNPAGSVDSVYAYKRGAAVSDGYGDYHPQQDVIRGSVLMTVGNRFAGAFRKVIPEGHVLRASQSILLSETASFDVIVERLVAACPPPPAAAPAPDVTGPSGRLILPKFLRESLLRNKGMKVKTDVSEAGSVRVDVYADDAAALTGPNPEYVRLAGGKKTTATAGRISIKLKATKLGRQAMKGHQRVKAIVVATITDTSGNVARLTTKKITIR